MGARGQESATQPNIGVVSKLQSKPQLAHWKYVSGFKVRMDTNYKETYLEDLTKLVADVRQDIFSVVQANDKKFAEKSAIPVLIVEFGAWAHTFNSWSCRSTTGICLIVSILYHLL